MNEKQNTESMTLETARKAYEYQREQERKKLSNFLTEYIDIQKMNLEVIRGGRAGKGWVRYSSGGKIAPYDLSNWKWVEIMGTDSEFNCVVSLNMPDVDPHSGNAHFLFDRVGLLISCPNERFHYETEIFTDIELPFDDDKMKCIATLITEQFEFFYKKKENTN